MPVLNIKDMQIKYHVALKVKIIQLCFDYISLSA